MRSITKIAVSSTVDPMPDVMECLFEKCETFISNEILEAMKKMHSYTRTPRGNQEIYKFHKRGRGTHVFFEFSVIKGGDGNKVSNLEYTTELGVAQKHDSTSDVVPAKKVYVAFKGERRRRIIKFIKSLWAKR